MEATVDQVTYVARGEEIAWGFVLLAFSLIIHGFGMVLTLSLAKGLKPRFGATEHLLSGLATLILGSWTIVAVHIVEIALWAGFFQWKQCFASFSTAIYFTGLQYTTVGSTLNLPRHWRLLEIMVSSAGLMGFAWSTGVLMTLAKDFQEQQLRSLGALRLGGRSKPDPAVPQPLNSGKGE
jgi:voltage-gated potassium channel